MRRRPRGPGRHLRLLAPLVALALLSSACTTGLIYTHVRRPLSVDFHETPSQIDDEVTGPRPKSWKTVVIPLIVVNGSLQFDWGDTSIATAMERAGITKVYYADIEEFSVLRYWREVRVHVYGE